MDLTNWYEPDPAVTYTLASDADWDSALERYRNTANDMPFDRCIEVARQHGAKHVVIETRYADLDFRSEHHALYGRSFADVPAFAHRLHFFAGNIGADLTELPEDHGYIGYVVTRPVPTGLVSRAMLPPPPDAPSVQCTVEEIVGLFGQRLRVEGVPFAQQDTQLGACAHAAAWVCHYSAHLRGEVERRPRAEFALQADPSLSPDRSVPTKGLTVQQLSDLLRRFGLPPEFYQLGALPSTHLSWQPADPVPPADLSIPPGRWDTRLFAVICRHLNGGYPVLVGTYNHAFVIIGWDRNPSGDRRIRFCRHDDQRGPYLTVDNPFDDKISSPHDHDYGPWRTFQVPLPPRLWLAPEPAERVAGATLVAASEPIAAALGSNGVQVETLKSLITHGRLALRTYAISSEKWKSQLPALGFDRVHIASYRLARMPRHVWVVEAVDRHLRDSGAPPVLGEAVVDATSGELQPQLIGYRLHGAQAILHPARKSPLIASPHPTRMGGRV